MFRESAALSSAHLITQCLQNSAKSGERSVLALGSLCLPCCVRDTAWSWFWYFFYICSSCHIKQVHTHANLNWSIFINCTFCCPRIMKLVRNPQWVSVTRTWPVFCLLKISDIYTKYVTSNHFNKYLSLLRNIVKLFSIVFSVRMNFDRQNNCIIHKLLSQTLLCTALRYINTIMYTL